MSCKGKFTDEIKFRANTNDYEPLSVDVLRERLKHIAGLCWGLSIDLENSRKQLQREGKEFKKLSSEKEELEQIIKELKAEYKKERTRIYNREYRQKRRAENDKSTN